ncbi:hypothetical protein XEUV181_20995 [Xanthomonas euvesicatoria]|nr:hypothetical protein BHE83_17010 [Xanthomonas euvesicatoria pv. vesicatoria str. 85-10]APO92131.1 hypothetical protein BJD11_20800 [Xanthomonas euvesicatoria]KHL66567.1 hypothetical protein XEU83M_05995 [Xanthomonas euvesicatoria]KLA86873.1 hypothetical protein XEUV181_20995 [Xanthomonas euvesicatoria]KLB32011.1 hypothetical protein XEUV199_19975 [Xanthomonas euvesicatoria]
MLLALTRDTTALLASSFPVFDVRVKVDAFRSDGAIESRMQCLPRAVSDLRRSRHEAVVFHDCW